MDKNRKSKKLSRQRKRKRRLQRIKKFFTVLIILAAVIGITVVILWNVFKVKEVVYSGNNWNDSATIESYLFKDKYDRNSIIFVLKDKYLKKKQIPYVETYEVKADWPSKLVINVYEKKIMGYIATDQGNMYFDKDGIVVECTDELLETVPGVEGIDVSDMELHKKMNISSDVVLSSVTEIKQQLDKYHIDVDKIIFDENGNITLQKGDIYISFGKAQYLTEKVFEYSRIRDKLIGKKGKLNLEACDGTKKNYPFTPSE